MILLTSCTVKHRHNATQEIRALLKKCMGYTRILENDLFEPLSETYPGVPKEHTVEPRFNKR